MIAFASKPGFRAAALAALMLAGLSPAAAADATGVVDLTIDFAKIMKLDGPADTIVIGNPGIADATVQDENTLVLTGRSAGTTNLIVLDPEGKEVVNSVVRVSSDIRQLTTVFYGSQRQTFSCAPTCEHVISVGDANEAFSRATSQLQTRTEFSQGN